MPVTDQPASVRRKLALAAILLAVIVAAARGIAALKGLASGTPSLAPPELPPVPPVTTAQRPGPAASPITIAVADSLLGMSQAVRFRTLTPARALATPGFVKTLGERALRSPAVYRVPLRGDATFTYIVLRPFGEKHGDVLNGYRLGRWPAERWMMARNYYNPDGFIEVTPENMSLALSAHFTLGAFATHDQRDVWPKYVVVTEKLIDKLELVLADLHDHGRASDHVVVLSGFRAPYYNDRGVGEGMARASRHQYGDAADIIIDEDGNGRMDDLNGDGRIDVRDTEPIMRAIGRVEQRYPDLVGGLGTYAATGPSGPFAHVDVRGTSARWESGWWKKGDKGKRETPGAASIPR